MEIGFHPRTLARTGYDLFFPRKCRSCSAAFDEGPSNWICSPCLETIAPIDEAVCGTCGKFLYIDYHVDPYQCGDCLEDPPPYQLLRSFGKYEDTLRNIIHWFKYNRIPGLADDLARFLMNLIKKPDFPKDFEAICYVPVHKKKLIERGFDPAFLIAQKLSIESGRPILAGSLLKTRETVPQVLLARKDRLKNVKGSFSFMGEEKLIQGKKVLLVDDVFTTGATTRECSNILMKHGAKTLYCLTAARA